MLLADDTACYGDDDGSFEIGPIMDGGWYWITDEDNSAVGGLVDKNVLDNANDVMPTDAGDGVTVTAGSGAVLLKETASGRVGILPTILPVMDMDAPTVTVCGFVDNGRATPRFTRRTSNCAMGDGGNIILATTTDGFTGATVRLMDEGTLYRPAGDAVTNVTIDAWGNHSGFFTTDPAVSAMLGQPAFALTGFRPVSRLTGITVEATLGATGPDTGTTLPAAGVALTAGTDSAEIAISADTDYCDGAAANHSATVNVTVKTSTPAIVTPNLATARDGQTLGTMSFTVICQSSAAANMGQELVPDNPFPTTE